MTTVRARKFVGTQNCATCGKPFQLRADAAKVENRGKYCSIDCSNRGRSLPLVADVADLRRLYVEEKKTTREIAAIYGSNWKHVSRALKRIGVKPKPGREGPRQEEVISALQEGRGEDGWPPPQVPGDRPPHRRQLEEQRSGEPCRCIEEAAFRIAQAIGSYLGTAIHGWPHYFRSPDGLPDDGYVEEPVEVDGNESIPDCAVGAPHRRDRVWIVAYPGSDAIRDEPGWRDGAGGSGAAVAGDNGAHRPLADPDGGRVAGAARLRVATEPDVGRREGERLPQHAEQQGTSWGEPDGCGAPGRRAWPLADACRARLALGPWTLAQWAHAATTGAGWWATEPDVGRVAARIPDRVDRLRCLGNSIVPQIAELLGRAINHHSAHMETGVPLH